MRIKDAESLLADTIERWRANNLTDQIGVLVCQRLAASPVVAKSFSAVRPDGQRWDVLLGDCVTAQHKRLAHGNDTKAALEHRDKSKQALEKIKWLRNFYADFCVDNEMGDIHPALAAIDFLAHTARESVRTAERFISERSRKADDSAAVSAAVGWIKESIRSTSGGANIEHVRIISEAALGLDSLSADTVIKAVSYSEAIARGYTKAKSGGSAYSTPKKAANGQTSGQ